MLLVCLRFELNIALRPTAVHFACITPFSFLIVPRSASFLRLAACRDARVYTYKRLRDNYLVSETNLSANVNE